MNFNGMNFNGMNFMQFLQQFNQFTQMVNQKYPGVNPQSIVQNLMNTGEMSQEQFEMCRKGADILAKMFG